MSTRRTSQSTGQSATTTSDTSGPATRRRRPHHKSRKGCSECKKRHIKCDEGRPQCANCTSTQRWCSFFNPHDWNATPASSVANSNDGKCTSAPYQSGTGFRFSAVHLVCLHHAETHMEEYLALNVSARPIIDLALDHIATAPYLLDQVLALSALHLSTRDVAQNLHYHQQATQLQTRALELFSEAQEASTDKDCIPAFVFASLLGIHVLQETLSTHQHDLSGFVDAFTHYVRLNRGVRTVLAYGSWSDILQSDLKPFLYLATLSAEVEEQEPGQETQRLNDFLNQYNAGQESVLACQGALRRIQWMLDLCNKNPSMGVVGIHATLAWPLLVDQEYFDALHQHRPEAFAVLAFYAAALHRYKSYWVFGDSGLVLLSAILSSIGSFWRDNLGMSLETDLDSDIPDST